MLDEQLPTDSVAFQLRGFYGANVKKKRNEESPEDKQQRIRAIQQAVEREINARERDQKSSLGVHQQRFDTRVIDVRNTTEASFVAALNTPATAKEKTAEALTAVRAKAVIHAMKEAFSQAIGRVGNPAPDFNKIIRKTFQGYNAIIQDFQQALQENISRAVQQAKIALSNAKNPQERKKIENDLIRELEDIREQNEANLSAQLVQFRNVIDYGYPPAFDGFAQLISPSHPYYEQWRLAVMAIDADLDKIDEKVRVLSRTLAKEGETQGTKFFKLLEDLQKNFLSKNLAEFNHVLREIYELNPKPALQPLITDLQKSFVADHTYGFNKGLTVLTDYFLPTKFFKLLDDLQLHFSKNNQANFLNTLAEIERLDPSPELKVLLSNFRGPNYPNNTADFKNKFNQLSNYLNPLLNTELVSNSRTLFDSSLEHDILNAFNHTGNADSQLEALKHFFAKAIEKHADEILQLVQNNQKDELINLYLDIAKEAYWDNNHSNSLTWEQVATEAKAAAERDYEKVRAELKQEHIQKIKSLKEGGSGITLSTGKPEDEELEPGKEYNLTKSGVAKLKVGEDGTFEVFAHLPSSNYDAVWHTAMFAGPISMIWRSTLNKADEAKVTQATAKAVEDIRQSMDTVAALAEPGMPITVSSPDPKVNAILTRELEARGLWVIGGASQFEWKTETSENATFAQKAKKAATVAGKGVVAAAAIVTHPVMAIPTVGSWVFQNLLSSSQIKSAEETLKQTSASAASSNARSENAYRAARKKGLGLGQDLRKELDLPEHASHSPIIITKTP